jgi:hypothetical protein
MSHLIQSIPIGSTRYCVKHGASTPKWRTISFPDLDMILESTEDADNWEVDGDGMTASGYLSFATCCLWKATVRFFVEADIASYIGTININGTLIDDFNYITSAGETVDFVIDLNALGLINRACGNFWEIEASYSGGLNAGISVSIIDVTFGPPV